MQALNSSPLFAAWRSSAAGLMSRRAAMAASVVASKPRSANAARAAASTSSRWTFGRRPIGK